MGKSEHDVAIVYRFEHRLNGALTVHCNTRARHNLISIVLRGQRVHKYNEINSNEWTIRKNLSFVLTFLGSSSTAFSKHSIA